MVKFPYGVRGIQVVFYLFQSFQVIKKYDFMLMIVQTIDYDISAPLTAYCVLVQSLPTIHTFHQSLKQMH